MKARQNIISYVVCIAIALVFGITSLTYDYFVAKIVPLITCGLVILLAVIGILTEVRKQKKGGETEPKKEVSEEEARETWPRYARTMAWLVGLFIAIYIFGFLIAVPVFLFTYMLVYKTRWYVALSITVVTSGILYTVFVVLLKVSVFKGLIFA
jgi:putative exporter of polyketide antibiotics